jgi:hypothetical protein
MNNLIEIYVDGSWNADFTNFNHIEILEKGKVFLMKLELYDSFIDNLENNGFDNYFCPQLFKHPSWNGVIKYINS